MVFMTQSETPVSISHTYRKSANGRSGICRDASSVSARPPIATATESPLAIASVVQLGFRASAKEELPYIHKTQC